jgi:hypothetical protein
MAGRSRAIMLAGQAGRLSNAVSNRIISRLQGDNFVADPRAFVSFDFDHDEITKILFVGQAKKESPTPFVVADWSSKSSLPQSQWEAIIAEKIGRCNLMIVLVGRYMGTAYGVAEEIRFAKAANVPFFGVYVDGANSYPLCRQAWRAIVSSLGHGLAWQELLSK